MENKLDDREQKLVSLGAAIASNCVPCVEYHIPEAKKAGCSDAQIREAVHIADKVRRVPANLVLKAALARVREAPSCVPEANEASCGCGKPS